MKTKLVIKNARIVATSSPDINRYPSNPIHAHIIAGIRAGMRRVIYGIDRNIKKNIANIQPPTNVI